MKRLEAENLESLLSVLKSAGYLVMGPKVRDQAIVYEKINSVQDLPRAKSDEQEPGRYRLKYRDDGAYFGYTSSPQSWKQFLFPARERLWRAVKERKNKIYFVNEKYEITKQAFLGVRACDVVAISIQDRTFIEGQVQDSSYKARREAALLIAVQCGSSSSTCFCASMGTGPEVSGGFDLLLSEVIATGSHFFLIRAGSEEGARILDRLAKKGLLTEADLEDRSKAKAQVKSAAQSQRRAIDPRVVRDALARNFEHPRWDAIANRCLNCANCTLVCPTCFCSSVEDTTDLKGNHAERWRRWDSCFALDHSYIHGGHVRVSAKSRYRQWLTHKLSTWWEQFGVSGCVGCGRCITWCPVGIDITEEVEAIQNYEDN
jgi:sulfhydrogenase subunit beta (sulfur reductase)